MSEQSAPTLESILSQISNGLIEMRRHGRTPKRIRVGWGVYGAIQHGMGADDKVIQTLLDLPLIYDTDFEQWDAVVEPK